MRIALAAASFIILGNVAHADSPICVLACVKAEAKGLSQLADALKYWAKVLPQINEQFHDGVRQDMIQMESVASNLINELDRTAKSNVDYTNASVRALIDNAVDKINQIGESALLTYKKALYETECFSKSILGNIKDAIDDVVPSGQWIRSLFGYKYYTLKTIDLSGKEISENYDPKSKSDRFQAGFRLYSRKFESGNGDTPIQSLQDIALDRRLWSYAFYCEIRASSGDIKDSGHIYDRLQEARRDYNNLTFLVSAAKPFWK